MSESNDPRAYPPSMQWKGITDEKPIDRIVGGNKTMQSAEYVAIDVYDQFRYGSTVAARIIHADRLQVFEMCREAIDAKFADSRISCVWGEDDVKAIKICIRSALYTVKEKLK